MSQRTVTPAGGAAGFTVSWDNSQVTVPAGTVLEIPPGRRRAPPPGPGVERDDAAAGARARAQMFHKGLASTLWTAKRHIDPARWRAFIDDLRRECEPRAPRDTPSRGRRQGSQGRSPDHRRDAPADGDAAMRTPN